MLVTSMLDDYPAALPSQRAATRARAQAEQPALSWLRRALIWRTARLKIGIVVAFLAQLGPSPAGADQVIPSTRVGDGRAEARAGPTTATPGIPSDMVAIPSTSLIAERSGDGARANGHAVEQVRCAPFLIDRTEVSVRAYEACVRAGRCSEPHTDWPTCNWRERLARRDHPVNCVDWNAAIAYCTWLGKRLPSETEWEFAARGHGTRTYPWGEAEPAEQLCWARGGSNEARPVGEATCPVGSHPAGASPFGVQDLAGNVWEWTSGRETLPGDVPGYVLRGGGWADAPLAPEPMVRVTDRLVHPPTEYASDIGFRCARSLDGKPRPDSGRPAGER